MTDGKGMLISKNKLGGWTFTLRKEYLLSSNLDAAAAATSGATDDSCPDGQDLMYRNCGVILGPLYKDEIYTGPRDHFFSTFKINFNLWLMVILALVYFIWALGTTYHDPLNPHYENNPYFNYPVYSIWTFGNPRQTKVSRLTLLLMSITSYWLAASLFNWVFQWDDNWMKCLVSAAIGVGFSWIVTRIFGFILLGLNRVHHRFLDDIKKCDNFDAKEKRIDQYENEKLSWNYLYYSLAFAYFAGVGWGTIGININFDNEKFWWMMISLFFAMLAEALIFDPLAVICCKGQSSFARWFQIRGYYIDYQLHKNYDQFVSDED